MVVMRFILPVTLILFPEMADIGQELDLAFCAGLGLGTQSGQRAHGSLSGLPRRLNTLRPEGGHPHSLGHL